MTFLSLNFNLFFGVKIVNILTHNINLIQLEIKNRYCEYNYTCIFFYLIYFLFQNFLHIK